MSTPESPTPSRTAADVRRDIQEQRAQLSQAVEMLRGESEKAKDVGAKLQDKLPLIAAGALAVGFVLAGGLGATARYFARRSREGSARATLGPFVLVDRD
jgi:hypothetical protein